MCERVAVILGLVAATVLALGDDAVLPAAIVFVVASVLAVRADILERRLPHRIVVPAIVAVLGVDGIVVLVTGGVDRLVTAALGAGLAFGGLLVLHLLSPTGLGFGDVTYGALIGATLGWFGIARVGVGLAFGFVAAATLAGPLVWRSRRAAGRGLALTRPTMPLGPALAAGAWIALCWGEPILAWSRN